MTIRTLIGFDFGSKRIGSAIGQAVTLTASPLQIIPCQHNRPDWPAILQLISDWQPDAIVVGVPVCMDGSRQEMTIAAEKFIRQLQGRLQLPVYAMDERLSTFEARSRSGDDRNLDAIAAQAILETWLTENRQLLQDENNT